jgi:sugar O-acyltransferase (sialic acid O-acetyltransferase NeuD family)
MKPIVLYGNGSLAKQVYLSSKLNGPEFEIVAFCVDDGFLCNDNSLFGLPLVGESDLLRKYPPDNYDMLSCIDAPSKLRNRLAVYDKLKGFSYHIRNYISPLACISDDVNMGGNNIIFAYAHVYSNTSLGHSNTVRPTAVIGHDITIGSGTNICEGAIIGGYAIIGNSCWLGLNCTVNNGLNIADDTLVASGAVIMTDTKQGTSYIGNPAKAFFSHQQTGVMMDFHRWGSNESKN